MAVSREFYLNSYGGSLLSETDWPAAQRDAWAFVDALCFGRLDETTADGAARMAVCAVAEVLARYAAAKAARAPGLAAAENDGYSERYESDAVTAARQNAECLAAAELYLPRRHPLRYAGVL